MHERFDAPPKLLHDPIAPLLAGPVALDRRTDALRLHVVLRTRFAEDRLRAAVERGVEQFVVLGAGFETFAYRQPLWTKSLRIFEVDQTATQTAKRERLAQAGLPIPPNLRFVSLDLTAGPLVSGLTAHGFEPSRAAFFSWLGVTMYLPRPSVDAVFRAIAGCAPGSEVAFSFAPARAAATSAQLRSAAAGERWQTFMQPAELGTTLSAFGFSAVEFLTPERAARAYGLDARSDGLVRPGRTSVALASVSSV